MLKFIDRLWHQYVKGHYIVFVPATMPDAVIRSRETGKPLINVFEQTTFENPNARYECNCGKDWYV